MSLPTAASDTAQAVLPYRYKVFFSRRRNGPVEQTEMGFVMPKHHDDIQRANPDLHIARIEIAKEQL